MVPPLSNEEGPLIGRRISFCIPEIPPEQLSVPNGEIQQKDGGSPSSCSAITSNTALNRMFTGIFCVLVFFLKKEYEGLENLSQTVIVVLTKSVKPKRSEVRSVNERFKELPEEKQKSVLNAAIEVFAKYDYKKASTDLIAAKAGVSKGLLFYYFHNKKELYLAAYEYAKHVTSESVVDTRLMEITDFFELITYAGIKKLKVLAENPYIVDFSLRSFYSEKEEVSDDLKTATIEAIDGSYAAYFGGVDFSKFKEDADPGKILRMLIWMMDGYLHEQQMHGNPLCLDEIKQELDDWINMLKRISYREEFL